MSDMKLIMENWRQHLQEAPFTDQVAGADIEKDLKQAAGKAAIAKAQDGDIEIQTCCQYNDIIGIPEFPTVDAVGRVANLTTAIYSSAIQSEGLDLDNIINKAK